jgi:hypothetical protein
MLSENRTEVRLNARSKASKAKTGPAQKIAPSFLPEAIRLAPNRLQKIALAVSAILLAAWLIALIVMARK